MIRLTHHTDPALQHIPQQYHPAIIKALNILCTIYPPQPQPQTQGSVLFIQQHDTPQDLLPITAKPLTSLEGVHYDQQLKPEEQPYKILSMATVLPDIFSSNYLFMGEKGSRVLVAVRR